MNLMKHIVLIIGLTLAALSVQAQSNIVRGTVRDAKETLIGVNVVVMNKDNRVYTGISTDMNGGYMLKIPADLKDNLYITFSFIGYKTKKVEYKGQKVIDVTLEADAQLIDEVVVTGTASRNSMGVSYKNLTASVQRMEMKDVEELPVTSLGEALQGKMANVDIVSSSGAPGSGMSIRIRGISSLSTSSEPLIVLDGIPYETEISSDFDFATANEEDLSGLVNLSPTDIAMIEVLKDAAATAVWGSKGANGVLLITTRQGTVGKMTVTVNQKINVNFEPKAIKQLNGNQYISLMHDELWNNGLETSLSFGIASDLTNPQINFDPNYQYWREFNQNTDWLSEITRNTVVSETNVSMSGGGDRATYRFSAGYLTELGTTIGTGFKRLNARLNLNYKFSNKFRITTGMAFSQGNRDNNYSNPRDVAMNKMPNQSPYVMELDGVTRTNVYFTPYETLQGKYSSTYNPVAMARESVNNTLSRDINLNMDLLYDIIPQLRYTGTLGFNISTSTGNRFLPQSVTGVRKTDENYNRSETSAYDGTSLYIKNQLTYIKTFKSVHTITATALLDINDRNSASRATSVSGGGSLEISAPTAGGIIRGFSSSSSRTRDFGVVGNLHYSYDNRYMAAVSYRYGANSTMNKENRWAGFPSVSLAWRLENERFMEPTAHWLYGCKLRASWGLNGRAPGGNFPSAGRFSTEANYGSEGSVGPSTMQLTNLKWEMVRKTNVGIDLSFFNELVYINFDWYKNLTTDLLQRNVKVPGHTGFGSISYFNSGKMSNEGWEFIGGLNDVLPSKDFSLTFNFNISSNKNVLVELPDNVNYMQYKDKATNGEYAQSVEEGHPLGSFYGFRSLGVYKDKNSVYARDVNGNIQNDIAGNPVHMRHEEREVSPGDAIYQDVNNDGVINKYDIVYIGNSMPKFTGGFGINFGYKGLRLTTFFHMRLKYDIINRARMYSESMYNYNNQSVSVLNRWRYEGDETNIPKALSGRGYNWLGSDRFVEDGSFFRLKQLTLSYNLPKQWLAKSGISKLSVFATGQDLFTWTKYSGQDPEVNINGGLDANGTFQLMGVDDARTPRARKISLGLTLEF